TPIFVPYHHFLGPQTYEFPRLGQTQEADLSKVKQQTKDAIAEILAKKLNRPEPEKLQQPLATLDELRLSSLDRMEINQIVERRFGFTSEEVPMTVGQLWALAQGLLEKGPPKAPPAAWFRPLTGDMAAEILDDTFAAAFVERALRNRR